MKFEFVRAFVFVMLLFLGLPRNVDAAANLPQSNVEHFHSVAVSYPPPPSDVQTQPTPEQIADFAWKYFVALNWPNSAQSRGQPDLTRKIMDPGPRVWETFKNSDQIFLRRGSDPGLWDSLQSQGKQLHLTSKATHEEMLLLHINQAVGAPLTDQHGNLVFYEKGCNRISYDFIRMHHYYDASNQSTLGPIQFPFGSLEFKAAWRLMTPGDLTNRYYCTSAKVFPPNSPPRVVTVGLVGFHITVKTPNAPQWIWATFEQVDNVPPTKDGVSSSFNNPSHLGDSNIETPPGTPTQVARTLVHLPSAVVQLNADWQKRLAGSHWQYYQLVGTQHPKEPHNPANYIGDPEPTLLANTVLETYIQSTSSCMACHSTAHSKSSRTDATTDFSFLLIDASSSKN